MRINKLGRLTVNTDVEDEFSNSPIIEVDNLTGGIWGRAMQKVLDTKQPILSNIQEKYDLQPARPTNDQPAMSNVLPSGGLVIPKPYVTGLGGANITSHTNINEPGASPLSLSPGGGPADPGDEPTGWMADTKTLGGVTVTAKKKAEDEKKNQTIIWVVVGVVALIAIILLVRMMKK